MRTYIEAFANIFAVILFAIGVSQFQSTGQTFFELVPTTSMILIGISAAIILYLSLYQET